MRQLLPPQSISNVGTYHPSPAPADNRPALHLLISQDDAPTALVGYPVSSQFDSRLNPSMAIIMAILLTAFVFMGFFSVYLKKCSSELEGNTNNRPVVATRRQPPVQGLDPAVVESLPMVIYSSVKTTREGKALSECSVCLNEFEDNEHLRLLPNCKHYFHAECIDMWLYSHTTCPLCRRSLLERLGSFRWPGWGSIRGSRRTRNEPDSNGGEPMVATEGGQAPATLDNPISGIDRDGNLSQIRQGVSSVRSSQRRQDLNDCEPCRNYDSSILGTMKSASSSSSYKGRTKLCSELRRSSSTGHSLVKRVFSRASLLLPGSSSSDHPHAGQPLSSSLPPEASGPAGLRRSRSTAMLFLSLSREDMQVDDASSLQRSIRSFSLKRAFSIRRNPQEAMASSMLVQASSSGSRRTFERLVVSDQ